MTEQAALTYLSDAGLDLVTQNFSCKLGEIDLIMADASKLQDHILVFVEVRYRHTNAYGGATASITPRKRQRIVRTARYFLQRHKQFAQWHSRFDVVALNGNLSNPSVQWIPNAFEI